MWRNKPFMKFNGSDFYGHLAVMAYNMLSNPLNSRRQSDPFSSHISSIQIYDSMVFLHYQSNELKPLKVISKGRGDLT